MNKAKGGFLLAIISLAFISAVVWLAETTKTTRKENAQLRFQQQMRALLPPDLQQQSVTFEPIQITDKEHLKLTEAATLYRVTSNGGTSLLLIPVEIEAYVGLIHSLVALDKKGVVQQVNILKHQETLGFVSAQKDFSSDFLNQFIGSSLTMPTELWAVKKDGGQFDHITGATVSSRAVIRSVHAALSYQHKKHEVIHGENNE